MDVVGTAVELGCTVITVDEVRSPPASRVIS